MSGKVGEMHKGTRGVPAHKRLGEQELIQVERGDMAEEASGLCAELNALSIVLRRVPVKPPLDML